MADQATERRKLGRELRKARDTAGLTQTGAAKVLRCGQAKINKIETTEVEIDPDDLDTLLTAYRVPAGKGEEIRELAGRCRRDRRRTGLPRPSRAFTHLSDREMDATEIRCLHSERIPGSLQSELYMLRQFKSCATSTESVVELLQRRQARTQLFSADKPPRYRVVLSESSLHRMPGGFRPDIVVDQIDHLLGLIDAHDRFELHMLTFDAPAAFVGVDFVVAQFDGTEKDFAYVEHPGGGILVKAGDKLSKLVKHWDELHGDALSRDESVKFLRYLSDEARGQWQTRM